VNQKALDRISRANVKRFVEKEADIQEACTAILLLDDWRVIHTDLKHLRGLGVQEPGIADDLFIRYAGEFGFEARAMAEVLWCEWKRIDPRAGRDGIRSTKASQKQKDWHTLERKRGALVLVAGVDFEASIEGFKSWYVNSGLMRNRIL
jgi:hypothetical protein